MHPDDALALLHGKHKGTGGGFPNSNPQSSSLDKKSSHQPTLQTKPLAAPSPKPQQSKKSASNQLHDRMAKSRGTKRKADEALTQQGSHKRVAMQLKDEAYIRNTMRIPTSKDYPDLSPNFFKDLKQNVVNRTMGLVELRSSFQQLGKDCHSCTLQFKSAAREESVVGEGRSTVFSTYMFYRAHLTPSRKLRKPLPISTWLPNFMKKMFSKRC